MATPKKNTKTTTKELPITDKRSKAYRDSRKGKMKPHIIQGLVDTFQGLTSDPVADEVKKIDYVLLQGINWFGKFITRGTIYRQVNGDYWQPVINKAKCPSLQIDFYTVRNNEEYFLAIES